METQDKVMKPQDKVMKPQETQERDEMGEGTKVTRKTRKEIV